MRIEKPALNPMLFYGPIVSHEFHGNISKDKGGYRFRFTLYFKSGDKYKTQRSGFPTMQEALSAKEHVIAELVTNHFVAFDYTVSELFDYWLYYYQIEKKGIRYNTFLSHRNTLYNHLLPSFGAATKVKNITSDDIVKAIRKIKRPSMKENGLSVAKLFFDFAVKNNYISTNPCIAAVQALKGEMPKRNKRDVICSVEKVRALLYYCKHDFPDMYMPLLLSLTLGTRISETIGIKYEDINFSAHEVYIRRQLGRSMNEDETAFLISSPMETKTAHGVRRIPIPDWVIDEIIVCRAKYEFYKKNIEDFFDLDYICCHCDGSPFHRRSFARDFKKLTARLNIIDITWHDLRHIYATLLRDSAVNMKAISEYLGHYSPDFTNEVYIHQDEVIYDCSMLEQEWQLIKPKDHLLNDSLKPLIIPLELKDYLMLKSLV